MKRLFKLIIMLCFILSDAKAFELAKVEKECYNGNYKLCSALGTLYHLGMNVEKNNTKAIMYQVIACQGDDKYCAVLDRILNRLKMPKLNNRDLLHYDKLACELNISKGCFEIGKWYIKKELDNKYISAKQYIKKSCDLGNSNGCVVFGAFLEADNRVNDAIKLYEKTCNEKNFAGCISLGAIYGNKKLKIYNIKKSIKAFKTACDMNDSESCYAVAYLYEISNDFKNAMKYGKIACDHENSKACHIVAKRYIKGDAVKKNYEKAIEFFKKACDNGFKLSCQALQEIRRIKNDQSVIDNNKTNK